ncbi:hypothetical protein FD754_018287 [Muntiacus muntjak]|uniref:TRAF-type domain-containing protein n=1 Tax=Muntiacus muntjak TaxID=9888 RepID=A0A5N3UY87_MUNMU|nr:hypothetical protein FD754_018287 [Muntiacus muntjak]
MAYSEKQTGVPCGFICQNSGNSIPLDFEPDAEHQFMEQELSAVPLCPVDKEVIKSQEVFKDNYCARDVLSLYVFCKIRLPDPCQFGPVQCSKENCPEPVLSKGLKGGKMPYCKKDVVVISLQNHEESLCSGYPVSCPNKCLQIIPRTEVDEPLAMCPEAERDCPFKGCVCTLKDKRGNLQDHERSALRDHRLLISDLYKSLEQRESKIQQLAKTVNKFKNDFKQFTQLLVKNGSFLLNMLVLASHTDRSTCLEVQLCQLLRMVNQQQFKFDLRPLVEAIDTVKLKITLLETNDQRLVVLEAETNKHNAHINIHKKETLDGHTVSIFSQTFYPTYPNLDWSGKGTYLSLNSGDARGADPNSSSFKRPDGEMIITSGCPRFVTHSTLENAKSTSIQDDILFLKVAVDLTDLDDL